MNETAVEICLYCDAEIPLMGEIAPVPAASDDAAWAELAKHHAGNCEWVQTRAHRRCVSGAHALRELPSGTLECQKCWQRF